MKKIKVMLMSLLVIGAVGGALAFKAVKSETWFCSTNPICPELTQKPRVELTDTGNGIQGLFCTPNNTPGDCPFSVTTDI